MKSRGKDPLKSVSLTLIPDSAAHSGKHMGKNTGSLGSQLMAISNVRSWKENAVLWAF